MGWVSRLSDLSSSTKTAVEQYGKTLLQRVFWAYYRTVEILKAARSADREPVSRAIRSPVNELIEAYVALVWPGGFPDCLGLAMGDEAASPEKLEAALLSVLTWSKFGTRKQGHIRSFAVCGDWFIKAYVQDERVALQWLRPDTVTAMLKDDDGLIEYLRLDVQKSIWTGRETTSVSYTEVWDLEHGLRVWEHDRGSGATVEMLGTADAERSVTLEEMGMEGVIPVVHVPFRDVDSDDDRGANAFWHAMDKIDETNALATSLDRKFMRYSDVLWAVQRQGSDSEGVDLPAPDIEGVVAGEQIDLSGEKFLGVNGQLQCLVPPIPYAELAALVADQESATRRALPELLWYEVTGSANIALDTFRLMLAPCETRIREARANAEMGLREALLIALRMAQHQGLSGFGEAEIGGQEAWHFGFEDRPVFPLSASEEAALEKVEAEADKGKLAAGIPWRQVMHERGYTDDEITDMETMKTAERDAATNLARVYAETSGTQQASTNEGTAE